MDLYKVMIVKVAKKHLRKQHHKVLIIKPLNKIGVYLMSLENSKSQIPYDLGFESYSYLRNLPG